MHLQGSYSTQILNAMGLLIIAAAVLPKDILESGEIKVGNCWFDDIGTE
jgi:hypothetical protein